MRKASRLLSLHQSSFHGLFHVLPTATPITADPRRQPAYSVQECTFAAYTHVLNSTKHYQNSRKESNWHTADCSLRQCARCVAALSTEQRVSSPQMAMPLPSKKGTSALQQKTPRQQKNYLKLSHDIRFSLIESIPTLSKTKQKLT